MPRFVRICSANSLELLTVLEKHWIFMPYGLYRYWWKDNFFLQLSMTQLCFVLIIWSSTEIAKRKRMNSLNRHKCKDKVWQRAGNLTTERERWFPIAFRHFPPFSYTIFFSLYNLWSKALCSVTEEERVFADCPAVALKRQESLYEILQLLWQCQKCTMLTLQV